MTVELWYGNKPRSIAEEKVWVELYQYLLPQEEHFTLLLNFCLKPAADMDLIVLKENGIYLAETEYANAKPVIGSREGPWNTSAGGVGPAGCGDTPLNPFKKAETGYANWCKWCEANRLQISGDIVRPWPADYESTLTFIMVYPDLIAGSQLDIGEHPVQAVGMSTFLNSLLVRSSNKINLSRQEMERIPRILGLNLWDFSAGNRTEPDLTMEVRGWRPEPFAVLVARGHNLSPGVFTLGAPKKAIFLVGRDATNDLVIEHQAISRQHAVIRRLSDRFVVQDLGSTSGTFVSYSGDPAREIEITGRVNAIKDGSMLRFGPAGYTFLHHK